MVIWLLLAWPFDGRTDAPGQDVLVGVLVALVVAAAMREVGTQGFHRWLNPFRYAWFVAYLFVLGYYVVKANIDVAIRILHPKMPIRPGIVRVRTTLRTASAITALANSITLTPGTLTVEALPDGVLYVHWINVLAEDSEGATARIVARFEFFIRRIFE